MPYNLIFIPVLVLLFIANPFENTKQKYVDIVIGEKRYQAELANTVYKSSKGMMFTDISEKEAMVFYYPKQSTPTFYNKNVKFPLRVYWVDSQSTVVQSDIFEKDSFKTYKPKKKIMYVVEIPLMSDYSNDPGVLDGKSVGIDL